MTALHVSPEEFRVLAGRVTELAAELYERLEAARAYPQTSGTQTRQAFDEPVPQEGLKAAALDALTQRETEVLRLIARGLSNTEISRTLVIAEQTTKTYVGRILAKLNLRDRAQAVVVAYETGLITPGSSG